MLVRDVMTATPMTIDPEAPVETAVAVMRERGLRHLPVVGGEGRLIGIVTEHDVLKALAATLPCIKGADPDTYLW